MRTVLILLGGLLLWGLALGAARLLAAGSASALTVATFGFIAVWLLIAAANLWIGVTQAGYSLSDELPIFALIFLLPAAVAALVRWKFL
jgi:hypothetical protein